jgi:hypothetical protein
MNDQAMRDSIQMVVYTHGSDLAPSINHGASVF